jgi:hypothetical protein
MASDFKLTVVDIIRSVYDEDNNQELTGSSALNTTLNLDAKSSRMESISRIADEIGVISTVSSE